MSSEKADLSSDQVSLPPTYAPSETFTDSPPPAYRKPGMAAVKVARVVCFTFLAMTFVIGFFVITHKWIQSRECNCEQQSSEAIQHAALFAQAPNLPTSSLDNNKIEESIAVKAIPEGANHQVIEEDIIPQEQVVDMSEEEVSPDSMDEDEFEELNNDIRLPKDLLLGNPQLAGRNVHCKVEKRQRRITEGIMTQAIIVTCDDDENDEEMEEDSPMMGQPPMSLIPVKPPMSLLSTIMKVLSARPPSMEDGPQEEPRRLPFPIRAMPRPMHPPMAGPPLPFIRTIEGPSYPGPFPGHFHGHGGPVLVPVRKIHIRKPFHLMNQDDEELEGGEPHQMMDEGRFPHIHGMAPPLRFIQRPFEETPRGLPFPLPSGAFPIRVIRLSPRNNEQHQEDEELREIQAEFEDNEGPLPMPIHPLMRLFPQGRRITRLMQRPPMDESLNGPLSFPFPRGALPLPHPEDMSVPHHIPQASGRALPSPVALPQGVRVVRLPFRPPPQPFPEAKLITHMEVRQHPEEENQPQDPQNDHLQNVPENQSFKPTSKDFGPPKTHTVLESSPPLLFGQEEQEQLDEDLPEIFHREPIIQSESQPQFVAPPPRFAREGRTSFQAELNPDAEVIPQNPTLEESPIIHRIVLN